jgi:NADPH-dependent curcumin reductase CurA
MRPHLNRQWRLVRRPVGMVTVDDFALAELPVPPLRENECLVRTLYVSFDPAMRAFLHDRPSYVPPQPVGQVMRAGALAQVVESRNSGLQPDDIVQGAFGWQEYAVAPIAAASKIVPRHPLPHYLSVLGGTGLTAYFGLMEVGRLAAGETVLISGAAGATGSTAAQIAKLKGCRTIGIAGGAEKCSWLLRELRLDGAIDYKRDDVAMRLSALCPDGVQLYFDNVGGSTLETAIGRMAPHGRIVLCGMISEYNAERPPAGPSNLFELISRRIRMEGFLLLDYATQFERGRHELEAWLDSGELKAYVDVQEGFENIPNTFLRIFTGANIGKQLLKIADPDDAGSLVR